MQSEEYAVIRRLKARTASGHKACGIFSEMIRQIAPQFFTTDVSATLAYYKDKLGFDCLGQRQMKNVAPVTSYRVTMSGGAARRSFPVDESPTPPAGAVAAPEAGAPWIRDRHLPSTWMRSVSDRLAALPRPIKAALTVSGFLILINAFTGMHRIWFHWPVAALLFLGILRTVLRRRPASDREGERRTSRE